MKLALSLFASILVSACAFAACLVAPLAIAGEAEDIAAAARALSDPDAKVRQDAASALWKKEKAAAPAKAALVKALDDPSPAVVIRAAGALSYLGMNEAELAPARQRVLDALARRRRPLPGGARPRGPRAARKLVGPMLAYLDEYPGQQRGLVAKGPGAPCEPATARSSRPSRPALRLEKTNAKVILLSTLRTLAEGRRRRRLGARRAAALRDPESPVRNEALFTLGHAGALAAPHADAVAALLSDPDPALRRRAAITLSEIGDPRAQAALAKLNDGSDAEVHVSARDAARKAVAPKVDPGTAFQALMTLDIANVRALLDAGLSPNENLAGNGAPLYVALQWAPLSCSPAVRPTKAETKAMVKLLLERGADANAGDASGNTPLMAAAMHGCDREVMRALIAAGAKVDAVGKTGLTAFEQGLASGHDGLEEIVAAGYRLAPEKAKALEQAYAGKPVSLALVKKAARKS